MTEEQSKEIDAQKEFLMAKINELTDCVAPGYGEEFLEELMRRLEKTVVDFNEEKNRYKITSLAEKPKVSEAPSNIGILGRYILDNSIFEQIVDSEEGETNLTDALTDSLRKSEVSGKILEGYHFDTGNPTGLVKASNFFMKNSKLILEKY